MSVSSEGDISRSQTGWTRLLYNKVTHTSHRLSVTPFILNSLTSPSSWYICSNKLSICKISNTTATVSTQPSFADQVIIFLNLSTTSDSAVHSDGLPFHKLGLFS